MAAFWEGVLAGYGIAIPVGVIAILIVEIGLRRGFLSAFMAGAGAASADLIYAALAAVAGEAVSEALTPHALILRIASAGVLIGLGGYGLWQLWRNRQPTGAEPKPGDGRSPSAIYLQFLGLTLLNPLTIAYFGALILGSEPGLLATAVDRTAFILGAALSSLSWQSFIAGMGAVANRRLSPRFQIYASLLGNLVVIALGLRIGAQIVMAG